MHLSKLMVAFTFVLSLVLVACVTTDDVSSTSAAESALSKDACSAKDPSIDGYDEVTECANSNPPLVLTALDVIVASGGTCKAVDKKTNACLSIEPLEDQRTLELGKGLRCRGTYCRWAPDGSWKCTSQPACCVDDNGSEFCIPLPFLQ